MGMVPDRLLSFRRRVLRSPLPCVTKLAGIAPDSRFWLKSR